MIKNQLVTAESRKTGMGVVDDARLAKSIEIVKDGFGLATAPAEAVVFNASFMPPTDVRKVPG